MLDKVKNFVIVTVAQGYDSSATTISLQAGDVAKLPDYGGYNLVWWNATDYTNPADDPYVEIVRCEDVNSGGDSSTITRAQEGTVAQNHNLAGKTYKMILALTKKMIDDIDDNLLLAQIYKTFSPQSAKLPSTGYAQIDGGENNWRLLFDDTTSESAYWQDVITSKYSGETLYVDIYYTMTSATSGSVVWNVSIMAITPGDFADINTDSYDTANSVTDAVPSTAGYLAKATITLSNIDSLFGGDYFKIKVSRDAVNANDTAAGDAELIKLVLRT